MTLFNPLLGSAFAAVAALAVTAALPQASSVVVEEAWSRASLGASRPGVLYLKITNTSDIAMSLSGLETEVATMSSIHRTSISPEGIAKMEPAGLIEIAPGKTISLKPGGLHGMLMKLQEPLKEGDMFSVKLIFENGGEFEVSVPVLGVTATGPKKKN